MPNLIDDFYWWVAKMRRIPGGQLVPRDGWTLQECEQRKLLLDGRNISAILELIEKEKNLEVLRG
jgi:hypothetical protein